MEPRVFCPPAAPKSKFLAPTAHHATTIAKAMNRLEYGHDFKSSAVELLLKCLACIWGIRRVRYIETVQRKSKLC